MCILSPRVCICEFFILLSHLLFDLSQTCGFLGSKHLYTIIGLFGRIVRSFMHFRPLPEIELFGLLLYLQNVCLRTYIVHLIML